jgi:hypothetical protein
VIILKNLIKSQGPRLDKQASLTLKGWKFLIQESASHLPANQGGKLTSA